MLENESADEVLDIEPMDMESEDIAEPERKRYVQFIFDAKMVEFCVPWTREQIDGLLETAMADDGYIWVDRDEERGTGAFINLRECTCIKIVEREVPQAQPMPTMAPESEPQVAPAEPVEEPSEAAMEFLSRFSDEHGLPKLDGVFGVKRARAFYEAIVRERFGLPAEEASDIVEKWRLSEDGLLD